MAAPIANLWPAFLPARSPESLLKYNVDIGQVLEVLHHQTSRWGERSRRHSFYANGSQCADGANVL